jgi:tetratricopeptide (TPR) repeat protein
MGRYDEAIDSFRKAEKIYRMHDPLHRNRARCLINLAAALRLKAGRIESDPIKKSKKIADIDEIKLQREINIEKAQELRAEAVEYLKKAKKIYKNKDANKPDYRIGKCHYILALCYLDDGELDRAEKEAGKAYKFGEEKNDNLMMARAKITQCVIRLGREASWVNADMAQEWATSAVVLAEASKNRRVKARAYIWKGYAMLRPPRKSSKIAGECLHQAELCLNDQEMDYLREDLNALREEIGAAEVSSNIIFSVEADLVDKYSLGDILFDCKKSLFEYVHNNFSRSDKGIAEVLKTDAKTIGRIRAKIKNNAVYQQEE